MAATLIPIGALAWLGVRIVGQDRDLERQRRRESLEAAAGRLALAIELRLRDIEAQLGKGSGVRLAGCGPALLYCPGAAPGREAPAQVFAEAERLEFQRPAAGAAAAEYGRLAASPEAGVQAAALVRLARVLRKQGDRAGASAAYARLERLGRVTVAGQPAELLALQGRCRLLEEAGDTVKLRGEADGLARRLYAGGWRFDRATFDLYRDMVERWGGPAPPADALARTEAAVALGVLAEAGTLPRQGRRILHQGGMPVLAVWEEGPDGLVAWLGAPPDLQALIDPLGRTHHLAASLQDSEGRPLAGAPSPGAVVLAPGDSRLPFVLRAAWLAAPPGENGARGRLLIAGLLLTFGLILAASYGLYRATTRELALVRQQSDFVSAVSHEFRTPLTSMRHLTDLLVSRSVPSEERKAQYYGLLAGEIERLHRMVESLLSFGRIEAGAYNWRLEPVDPSRLAAGVVEEFRAEPRAGDREVLFETEDGLPPVRADREALARALWNLLENAAKYSEAETPIRVDARRDGAHVLLSVADQGSGIPAAEQKRVFDKFVRGEDARRAGIRGVGIGLALVKRIAAAHGGTVRLESEPGRGSTFTLVLPCHES